MRPPTTLSGLLATSATLGLVPGLPSSTTPRSLDPASYARYADSCLNGLTFTWFDRSPLGLDTSPRADGVETAMLAVTYDDLLVAELRVSFTTPELLDEVFCRPLAFAEAHLGWTLGLHDAPWRTAPITAQELWAAAHRHAHKPPLSLRHQSGASPWSLSAEDAPADPTVLERDLAELEGPVRESMVAFLDCFRHPFVAWSSVNRRGDVTWPAGLGSVMYLLAADQVATWGRTLRGSSLCSDSAQGLWGRLRRVAGDRVGEVASPNWRPNPLHPERRVPTLSGAA